MLSEKPYKPIKGRGYVRVKINTKDKDEMNKFQTVKIISPAHCVKTGNRKYLSPEAYAATIEEILK